MGPPVIAIHGDYSSGRQLNRDMGNPRWVDGFLDWSKSTYQQDVFMLATIVNTMKFPPVLVGYSRGGQMISDVLYTQDVRIAGAVVYEAPTRVTSVPPSVPVLLIWNHRGRKNTAAGRNTQKVWEQVESVTELEGRGRHIGFTWRPPFLRHAWDQTLNPVIEAWLDNAIDI